MKPKLLFLLGLLTSAMTFSYAAEAEDEMEELSPPPVEEISLIAAADNLGPIAAGFASDTFGPEDEDDIDPRVLRDFIESRGLIQCRQKEGSLTIAGDVRARWTSIGERLDGRTQRGQGTGTAVNTFKSEVNLFLDYVAPRAWVSTKLRWVNFDGRDGGTATKTEMDRAFIGYDIYSVGEDEDFYIEIGRSKLDYLFESRVEFGSVFDGIHLFYTKCLPNNIGQFTIHGGPFIIDSFTNHYGWAVETFINKWYGTGFSFKYSLIDWYRRSPTINYGNISGKVAVINNPRYQFLVSQMLVGYEKKVQFLGCKSLFLYGAVLANHDAKRRAQTNWKKLNGAWYVGFTLGKLCKACDWSIDINYQSVQAQAVPEFDLSGFGHGNAVGGLLSDAILLGTSARGLRLFTNYKGWQANLLYAMTDSLSLRAKAERAVPRNKGVGGNFRYKSFEMAVIYAF